MLYQHKCSLVLSNTTARVGDASSFVCDFTPPITTVAENSELYLGVVGVTFGGSDFPGRLSKSADPIALCLSTGDESGSVVSTQGDAILRKALMIFAPVSPNVRCVPVRWVRSELDRIDSVLVELRKAGKPSEFAFEPPAASEEEDGGDSGGGDDDDGEQEKIDVFVELKVMETRPPLPLGGFGFSPAGNPVMMAPTGGGVCNLNMMKYMDC